MRLIRTEAAKADLTDLADYIAVDDPEAALRFLDAAEAAFHFLLETPAAGASRSHFNPSLRGLRMWPIRGFEKHLIFYRDSPAQIDIIRVLHSSRDIETILGPE